MKRAWLCVPLMASFAFAQSSSKLEADLMGLNGGPVGTVSQQLTTDILSLAETKAQPSRRVVLDFTDELTRALTGKSLAAAPLSQLAGAIVDVLHSDGMPTSKYRAAVDRASQALIAMGVTSLRAKQIGGRLMVVGQEVRGPDDAPANPPLLVK